jgi:K(+)-stimulated pyrophosphate-energized sodium pump
MLSSGVIVSVLTALVALVYSLITSNVVKKIPLYNPTVTRISGYIEDGAHAFLTREYRTVGFIIPVVALLLFFFNLGILKLQSISFLIGAILSASAGWFGMNIAVKANARTAEAA